MKNLSKKLYYKSLAFSNYFSIKCKKLIRYCRILCIARLFVERFLKWAYRKCEVSLESAKGIFL